MRCDSCVYCRQDGHKLPCYKCVECGYPYIEGVPADELADKYVNAHSPFTYPAAYEVYNKVEKELKKEFPHYHLEGVWRKSLLSDDRDFYMVLAKNEKVEGEENYCVWTCWNDTRSSLNHGHYNITLENAHTVIRENFTPAPYIFKGMSTL